MKCPLWLVILLLFLMSSFSNAEQTDLIVKINDLSLTVPPAWRVSNQTRDSVELFVPLKKERATQRPEGDKNPKPNFVIASEANMLITIEKRRNHAEAVKRLAEIASEYPEPSKTLIIGGWPAIERTYRSLMPQPGEKELSPGNIETTFATTAVAVGVTVVRFNTMLAPDADTKLLDQAFLIGQALRVPQGPAEVSNRELQEIKRLTKVPPKNS